ARRVLNQIVIERIYGAADVGSSAAGAYQHAAGDDRVLKIESASTSRYVASGLRGIPGYRHVGEGEWKQSADAPSNSGSPGGVARDGAVDDGHRPKALVLNRSTAKRRRIVDQRTARDGYGAAFVVD